MVTWFSWLYSMSVWFIGIRLAESTLHPLFLMPMLWAIAHNWVSFFPPKVPRKTGPADAIETVSLVLVFNSNYNQNQSRCWWNEWTHPFHLVETTALCNPLCHGHFLYRPLNPFRCIFFVGLPPEMGRSWFMKWWKERLKPPSHLRNLNTFIWTCVRSWSFMWRLILETLVSDPGLQSSNPAAWQSAIPGSTRKSRFPDMGLI